MELSPHYDSPYLVPGVTIVIVRSFVTLRPITGMGPFHAVPSWFRW